MSQPYADLVRKVARLAVDEAVEDLDLRRLVVRALERPPFVLSQSGPLRAAPLVLGAYQAAGGQSDLGCQVAAAMEMLTAALHLFDGLADGDRESSSADIQVGLALHYGMGYLLSSANNPSNDLRLDWSPVYRLMAMVCAGQQRDIDLQRQPRPTLDDAKTMTFQKTGAYGEALTLAGALAAGAPPELCRDLALVGQYLGTRGQLIDDATDAGPGAPKTSDIRLRKKTLPIVFFVTQGGNDAYGALRRRFAEPEPLGLEHEQAIREAIRDTGGQEATLVYASWLRMKAAKILEELQGKGCRTELLQAHIASTDSLPASPDGLGTP